MQNQRPTLFRVISTDYPSFLSALFPIVFDSFTVYFFFTGNDSLQLFLILSIGLTVVGIPFLVNRYRTIASVFEDGIQAKAVVTQIGFFRGRGRIDYVYTFQGQKLSSGNAINRNSRTRNLKIGQEVTVLVDRDNPKRAFVKEIYL